MNAWQVRHAVCDIAWMNLAWQDWVSSPTKRVPVCPVNRRCGGSLNFRLGSGPQSSSPLLNSQGERDDFTDRVGFGQSCVSEE
jgi:hypothetical protein